MRINSRFFKHVIVNAAFTILINIGFRYIPPAGSNTGQHTSDQFVYSNHGLGEAKTQFSENENNKEQPSKLKLPKLDQIFDKKKNAILLLASYRSGSSLTGEIFNQHDEVLYFFGKPA